MEFVHTDLPQTHGLSAAFASFPSVFTQAWVVYVQMHFALAEQAVMTPNAGSVNFRPMLPSVGLIQHPVGLIACMDVSKL